MNVLWRTILRKRALASVTIHRRPAPHAVDVMSLVPRIPSVLRAGLLRVTVETRPYIHILFRPECAEPWMTELESRIPKTPMDWLLCHGFGAMEYFDVRVGVASSSDGRM
jgi:hypothetical protein